MRYFEGQVELFKLTNYYCANFIIIEIRIRTFQRSDLLNGIDMSSHEDQGENSESKFFILPKISATNPHSRFNCTTPLQNFPPAHSKLFDSWKTLVDRYKAFMGIKHKRLNCFPQSPLNLSSSQNQVRLNQLDFVNLVRFKFVKLFS